MEPPASDPVDRGTMPAATAAAEPPLEPPGVRSRRQGLRVIPNRRFFVNPVNPNSGVPDKGCFGLLKRFFAAGAVNALKNGKEGR